MGPSTAPTPTPAPDVPIIKTEERPRVRSFAPTSRPLTHPTLHAHPSRSQRSASSSATKTSTHVARTLHTHDAVSHRPPPHRFQVLRERYEAVTSVRAPLPSHTHTHTHIHTIQMHTEYSRAAQRATEKERRLQAEIKYAGGVARILRVFLTILLTRRTACS